MCSYLHAKGADVETVLINGKAVMKERKVLTLDERDKTECKSNNDLTVGLYYR